ncbi:hypothetical protein IJH72_00150 [Candidatus Saccharibacteria bacterium]|nr:hypothetical protein [Candidatus Saccharibacteria bacterium]
MSVLTSLGILILSMLIMAFLQLSPGIFTLISHHAFGKFSKNKASDLSIFFIFGVEIINAIIFLAIYLIICALAVTPFKTTYLEIILFPILVALIFFFPLFYFRKGKTTSLFISRGLAKMYDEKAKTVKSRSDAFILGVTSVLPELFITIPLYCVSAIEIMKLGENPISRAVLVIFFVLSSILPHLIIHSLRHFHYNLADILRFRINNKTFLKIFLGILFLLLSILIITFRISL